MVRRYPGLKRPSATGPGGKKISPETHPQETATEEIGNRVLAFAAGWQERPYLAINTMPPRFKEGLSSSFDFSNSGLSLCSFTTRKLTHIRSTPEPLAPKLLLDAAYSKKDAGSESLFPKI